MVMKNFCLADLLSPHLGDPLAFEDVDIEARGERGRKLQYNERSLSVLQ